MENLDIKLNALKFQNAGVMSVKGRTQTKRCLVIPIEDNHFFVSANADGTPKAVYMDLVAYALREPKYDQTHLVKQSLSKEVREQITEEQIKGMPILGGAKLFNNTPINQVDTCNAPFMQSGNDDDLPF